MQHRDIVDPETSASFTVKRWSSDKTVDRNQDWMHCEIRLLPDNESFAPIVVRGTRDAEVEPLAEMVEVIAGTASRS